MKAKSPALFGLLSFGGPTYVEILRAQGNEEDSPYVPVEKTETTGGGKNITFKKKKLDIPL